jgi:hypothetical protein
LNIRFVVISCIGFVFSLNVCVSTLSLRSRFMIVVPLYASISGLIFLASYLRTRFIFVYPLYVCVSAFSLCSRFIFVFLLSHRVPTLFPLYVLSLYVCVPASPFRTRFMFVFPLYVCVPALCLCSRFMFVFPLYVRVPALCSCSRFMFLFPLYVCVPAWCLCSRNMFVLVRGVVGTPLEDPKWVEAVSDWSEKKVFCTGKAKLSAKKTNSFERLRDEQTANFVNSSHGLDFADPHAQTRVPSVTMYGFGPVSHDTVDNDGGFSLPH